jgi:Asp-tRNA(Asn)/Glu-tRNA(Gln) amidotransferase A subunit family amidase
MNANTNREHVECFLAPCVPGADERFAGSKTVTCVQHDSAWAFRKRFIAHLGQLLGNDGVLLMPTMPDIAPLLTAEESELQHYRDAAIQMLCIAGLSGFPQISLPTASRLGAPLGISLLGPRGADRGVSWAAGNNPTVTGNDSSRPRGTFVQCSTFELEAWQGLAARPDDLGPAQGSSHRPSLNR